MVRPQAITQTVLAAVMVEDDPDVAMLVADTVQGPVEHFVTGEEALEAFGSGIQAPFILLDLELPGMGGLEVLKRLRADPQTRRVPVVIFTGTDLDPDEGYRLGANAWVRKPRDADELIQAVRHIEAFWGSLNRTTR